MTHIQFNTRTLPWHVPSYPFHTPPTKLNHLNSDGRRCFYFVHDALVYLRHVCEMAKDRSLSWGRHVCVCTSICTGDSEAILVLQGYSRSGCAQPHGDDWGEPSGGIGCGAMLKLIKRNIGRATRILPICNLKQIIPVNHRLINQPGKEVLLSSFDLSMHRTT